MRINKNNMSHENFQKNMKIIIEKGIRDLEESIGAK